MQRIYEASDSLQAHIIKGMLEQQGIVAFVQGEHLQGGVGELPVFGLVAVSVQDEDQEQARAAIKSWEDDSSANSGVLTA